MFEIIVLLVIIAVIAKAMRGTTPVMPQDPPACTNGHKWEWVKPYNDHVEYLYCSKCKKTAQEILMD
jgi:hypothetical protein